MLKDLLVRLVSLELPGGLDLPAPMETLAPPVLLVLLVKMDQKE